ncbi:RNA polymerase sigma factor [Planctomycetota bacterium]
MNDARRAKIFYKVKEKYLRFLSAVLWKLSGDRELFTEAMQYALLGMWEHVDKLERPTAQSYIYRIALSANSKAWRNRVGRDGQGQPEWLAAVSNPEDSMVRAEQRAQVRQALAELPVKQSQAVVMRYLEQRDYPDVAERLGCSPTSARSHVSKAVAALREKLPQLNSEVNHD